MIPPKLKLLLIFTLLLLAAQCHTPLSPPLPTTPTGPTIRIALLSPAAGEMATFGRMARNGSIMAFDEWNEQGGIIHWTHHDPDGRHLPGWIKHNGRTYQ